MTNPIYQTVIVGGGFTGLFTALYLSHEHYPRSVILIERESRFSFKPLLYEYCTGEMDAEEVCPPYEELLKGSGVIFVQDAVDAIDLHEREVRVTSGSSYNYSNLVLALGSVTGYSGVEGAAYYAMPLRTASDALAIDKKLHQCLQQASSSEDPEQRRRLLTVVVIGGGPSGIEMACTLANLLPNWYSALGGNLQEIRVVLLNHGKELLKGDVNTNLRSVAESALLKRGVELILGAAATAIRSDSVEYSKDGKSETLSASTVIWTAGTAANPLIKDLPIPPEHRDQHGRLQVTPTLQLLDFPEVFAAGDCAFTKSNPQPPLAQVAYQQAAAIAFNLKALALGHDLKPAHVHLRGTLMKLGIEESVANIFDRYEIQGEIGHLIRQGTYLEMLPTPVHDLKVTKEWLNDEIIHRYINSDDVTKTAVRAIEVVGGVVVTALVARKLIQMVSNDDKSNKA